VVSELVFAQQSLQPKLSRRCYAGVSYALQNNTVFRRAQNWVSVSDGSRTDKGFRFCGLWRWVKPCFSVEKRSFYSQLTKVLWCIA